MKKVLLIIGVLVLAMAADANAQWRCQYATWDMYDPPYTNATGHNTIGVGVIRPNMFVALVTTRNFRSFMIPYVNADSMNGRRYSYGYGSSQIGNLYQVWSDGGFDQVQMFNAFAITATPDSFIYVANNNSATLNNDPDHNILVFKYTNDTITVVPPYSRTATGTSSVWGIAVDGNKRVYICNDTTNNQPQDLKIYRPAAQWDISHVETPLATIDLPNGIYKGIATSPDGRHIFICDFTNRRVLKYTGSTTTGYTLNTSFNFQLGARDTVPNSPNSVTRPMAVSYLSPNNILAVAVDSLFGGSASYSFGRIYLVNPNTGALISSDTSLSIVDQAAWTFALTGVYNNRVNGTIPGNASGYTSTFDVKWDSQGNLYTQSYYGWTVEKWSYNGTLPTITSVEEVGGTLPETYVLKQNYPNPFNPVTNIEFSILQSGHVSLKVYDVLGKEIASLVDEQKEVGNYKVAFDAQSLPSGTYFYTMRSGGFTQTKKMAFVK